MTAATLCPACGSASAGGRQVVRLRTARGGNRQWTRCSSCGSYFDTVSYDAGTEAGHAGAMPWGRPQDALSLERAKRPMYRRVAYLVRKYCPPPATVLDVGCGYGGFARLLQDEGYAVHGMEIVAQAVDHARQLGIQAHRGFSVAALDLPPGTAFDVVTCLDVNYYWPDQPLELAAIRARLKPGGCLVLRVVDKSWLAAIALQLRHLLPSLGARLFGAAVNDHRFSMPVKSLLVVLGGAGFVTVLATPRGAFHGDRRRVVARLAFAIGSAVWALAGRFCAPGALVVAQATRR